MFSKPAERRAIATQLVFLFTPAAACLLLAALGVLYLIVVRHAFEEDNVFLADKISLIRADIHRIDNVKSLTEELATTTAGHEHSAYWVRVMDSTNRLVAETPGMDRFLPSDIFPAPDVAAAKDYRRGEKLFSLVAVRERAGDETYKIEIAQDRSSDENFRKEFRALLIGVLAVGIAASIVIAITVTRRGLRPLAEMTRSLERTGPTHLNERMLPARWPRELQPVAGAFDEMLDRLEDSFTRLSQFSADLAHELRTPVANILGESQVSLTRARSAEEYRRVIESNVAECERLSGIIDSLLFLARAEAAQNQVHRKPFDGREAIEKIATYYGTIAEDRHVAITCEGEGEIYADRILFDRALSNLVDNALRFTPDSGTVRVSISQNAGHSEISVADNGCGIAEEHIARVFDRFYRVDPARSSHGSGLGLALVKSIVDLHGGAADVKSEVGRGAHVTLTFPRR